MWRKPPVPGDMMTTERHDVWPRTASDLDLQQRRLALLEPPQWIPDERATLHVGGCFLAFAHGEQGPGAAGDRGWAGAATVECPGLRLLDATVASCVAGAPYDPGRLALREGAPLEAAVTQLSFRPDVLLVDATGRDHPRRAGLALHLGTVLSLPTIGVTHRALEATGALPGTTRGATSPLSIGDEVVGAWVCTRAGARPVAVHAGWRVDSDVAVDVVLRCTGTAHTPEPLRRAREAARNERATVEGRRLPNEVSQPKGST